MIKGKKLYVNKLIYGREWYKQKVESLDPELIDTKNITQFEFLEQPYIIDGDEVFKGNTTKISPSYFVGVRKPISYAIEKTEGQKKEYYQLLAAKGYTHVCQTDFGCIEVMEKDDITLEEYKEQKKHTR
jgi:hypothetical protein